MLAYYKECKICGQLFRPLRHCQVTCASKECKLAHAREYKKNNKEQYANYKKQEKRKKRQINNPKIMLLLTQEAVAANNLGISYGEYKARQWLRNHGGR